MKIKVYLSSFQNVFAPVIYTMELWLLWGLEVVADTVFLVEDFMM